jgi:hypothetical protein
MCLIINQPISADDSIHRGFQGNRGRKPQIRADHPQAATPNTSGQGNYLSLLRKGLRQSECIRFKRAVTRRQPVNNSMAVRAQRDEIAKHVTAIKGDRNNVMNRQHWPC